MLPATCALVKGIWPLIMGLSSSSSSVTTASELASSIALLRPFTYLLALMVDDLPDALWLLGFFQVFDHLFDGRIHHLQAMRLILAESWLQLTYINLLGWLEILLLEFHRPHFWSRVAAAGLFPKSIPGLYAVTASFRLAGRISKQILNLRSMAGLVGEVLHEFVVVRILESVEFFAERFCDGFVVEWAVMLPVLIAVVSLQFGRPAALVRRVF